MTEPFSGESKETVTHSSILYRAVLGFLAVRAISMLLGILEFSLSSIYK